MNCAHFGVTCVRCFDGFSGTLEGRTAPEGGACQMRGSERRLEGGLQQMYKQSWLCADFGPSAEACVRLDVIG